MTAAGKITAARITAGDRVLVKHYSAENVADLSVLKYLGKEHALGISTTKTGEGVTVARVLKVEAKLVAGSRRDKRVYDIHTTEGILADNASHQTLTLAPEDAAGVKRAHVEALAEDKRRNRAATPAEVEAPAQAEVIRQAAELARTAPTQEAAAEIMAEAMGLTREAVAGWVATNWVAPAAEPVQEATTPEVEAWNAQNDEDAESERTGDQLPETDAPVVARPTSPALRTQLLGRVLRLPEPELVLDLLPPLAHGRELVRVADLLTLHSQAGKVDNMNNASETPAQAETAPAQKHTGSTVVALIEKVWDRIRADHPELPEVVVTTGSGEGVKWGHFRPESWKLAEAEGRLHEFFLASEALAKGATQVLQTTIHEAAHTLSKARGIKDTSRQGRWHNAEFKKAAEELGLEHKGKAAHKSHGFSFVTLTEATKTKYADLLAELDSELKLTGLLPLWMGGTDEQDEQGGEKITGKPTKGDGEGGTKSGPVKATCECAEPVIIRISPKVAAMGVVRCDQCGELFKHRD